MIVMKHDVKAMMPCSYFVVTPTSVSHMTYITESHVLLALSDVLLYYSMRKHSICSTMTLIMVYVVCHLPTFSTQLV